LKKALHLSQGILLAFLVLLFHTPLTAKSLTYEHKLADYVMKVCNRKCVDPQVLIMAIQMAAERHGLEEDELLAIARVESSFNPRAKNVNSVGLMQVNLAYHAKSFKVSPYDVFANLDVGASIYKACLVKRKGNVARALRCYNGEARKDMIYPNKVLKVLAEIRKNGNSINTTQGT